jgi:hypothetical protein
MVIFEIKKNANHQNFVFNTQKKIKIIEKDDGITLCTSKLVANNQTCLYTWF